MPERDHQRAGTAPVLNIGDDVGAVLVTLTGPTDDGELTACRRGEPQRHFHTGVHRGPGGGAASFVALFPEVPAGDYSLLSPAGEEHTPFTVAGGSVTRLHLRS